MNLFHLLLRLSGVLYGFELSSDVKIENQVASQLDSIPHVFSCRWSGCYSDQRAT